MLSPSNCTAIPSTMSPRAAYMRAGVVNAANGNASANSGSVVAK
jgi:hypothetical protein